jgi:hypothetical protein
MKSDWHSSQLKRWAMNWKNGLSDAYLPQDERPTAGRKPRHHLGERQPPAISLAHTSWRLRHHHNARYRDAGSPSPAHV